MATRIYLPSVSAVPPVSPAIDAGFTGGATPNFDRRMCAPHIKTINSMIAKVYTNVASTTLAYALRQYISPPLYGAQTVATGTFKNQIIAAESVATLNAKLCISLRCVSNDGLTFRTGGSFCRSDSATSPFEFRTTLTNQRAYDLAETYPTPFTGFSAQHGDRLVIEYGTIDTLNGTTETITMIFGSDESVDLPEDTTSTDSSLNPWIELTETLVFFPAGVELGGFRGNQFRRPGRRR